MASRYVFVQRFFASNELIASDEAFKEQRMKHLALVVASAVALCVSFACKSSQEPAVKSDLQTQWTDVNADAPATSEAAKAVLVDENLKDVSGKSTNTGGKVTGKMADGTEVIVTVQKGPKAAMSQISVRVGTIGNPSLGANLAKRIKMRAEGASI
jgi:hypothetical protein